MAANLCGVVEAVVSVNRVPDKATLAKMHKAMMAASPAYFASHMLTGPNEPPYNGRFIIGKHHLEWDKLAMGPDKVCVLASRNIGKSFYWSMALPLFFAVHQPGNTTFIVGSTQDTAQMIMARITDQLENNPKLQYLIPSRGSRARWTQSAVELSNGHSIHVASMNTKKRGFHPDNIIGDDLLSDESAYSETVRLRQINFYFSSVTPMLNPGGKMAVVGTPQNARDLLVGHLRNNPAYVYRVYPGERDGAATWPARLSLEFLHARRAEIGSLRYAREYLCQAVSDQSSLFPYELFKGAPTEDPTVRLGMPASYWKDAGMAIYMGVDIAMSSQVGADYTVIMVIAVDTYGNTWVVDIERVHGMPYHEQLALIAKVGNRYEPAVIAVESNQAQRFVADELIRTTRLPVVRHTTTAAKHSLEHGLPALKLMFENRKLRLPRGDARSIELTDIFADEFNNFTFINGKATSVGEHDDVALAYYIASQAPKLSAFNVSFGPSVTLATGAPVPPTAPEQAKIPLSPRGTASVKTADPFGFNR